MSTLFEDIFPPEGDIFDTPERVREEVSGWLANLAKGKGWTPEDYASLRAELVHAWDDATPWYASVSPQRAANELMDATRVLFAKYATDTRYPGLGKLAGGVEESAGEATKAAPREKATAGQVVDTVVESAQDVAAPMERRPYLVYGLAAVAVVLVIVAIAALARR